VGAADEAGHRHSHGFLYDAARSGDDRCVPIRDVDLTSEYDDERYHRALHAAARTDDHTSAIDGTVWSNIPSTSTRSSTTSRGSRVGM
jgi:hypothetical protein